MPVTRINTKGKRTDLTDQFSKIKGIRAQLAWMKSILGFKELEFVSVLDPTEWAKGNILRARMVCDEIARLRETPPQFNLEASKIYWADILHQNRLDRELLDQEHEVVAMIQHSKFFPPILGPVLLFQAPHILD